MGFLGSMIFNMFPSKWPPVPAPAMPGRGDTVMALKKVEWVAMIDINEYIVPAKGVESLDTLLTKEKKNKTASLRIYFKVF